LKVNEVKGFYIYTYIQIHVHMHIRIGSWEWFKISIYTCIYTCIYVKDICLGSIDDECIYGYIYGNDN
jgi:hypothetical protein